jgi:pseudouridine synthase
MRLNRFLARSGVASRRKSDELILGGTVQVNGQTVAEPGRTVMVGTDRVDVGGKQVWLPEGFEYLLLHKRRGCLVTRRDTHGRPTVFDQIEALRPGTVAVGRLDQDTTGALLLTDDGELTFRLLHPSRQIEKRYEALVEGKPDAGDLLALRQGVELEDGPTAPAQVRLRGGDEHEARLEICIHEGRKRQVRRMCAAVGHPVKQLKRVAFAGLGVGRLKPGQWRRLTPGEVRALRARAGLGATG